MGTSAGTVRNKPYTIQALQKALHILEVLWEAHQPLSLDALSKRAGMPKSTTFRIITNLLQGEYLTERPDGYWLGLKLLSLGSAVESHLNVRDVAAPFLARLRDLTNETVYLATLMQDMTVLYLDRAASTQPIAVALRTPGMTAEAYCTALGKSMLAYKPDDAVQAWLSGLQMTPRTPKTKLSIEGLRQELKVVRKRGYATDEEEYLPLICCIAAPIFDARGHVIAAVSIAGPKDRLPQTLAGSQAAEHVLDTAKRISAQMGASDHL